MSDDFIMKCPLCGKETKYIIQHLNKNKICKLPGDVKSFMNEFKYFKQINQTEEQISRTRAQGRERFQVFRKKKKEEDNAKLIEEERKRQEVCRKKKKEEDSAKLIEEERKRQEACMSRKRERSDSRVKQEQIKRSRLSRSKKREENPEKVKEYQNMQRQKHRDIKNSSDRLRDFREATKYTAIFICTCCHQRMFHSNVQIYSD